MSSPLSRRLIMEAMRLRLEALYGPKGSTGRWLRKVRRGVLMPLSDMRPVCTVHDGGQRRIDTEDGETSDGSERLLTVHVTVQLAEDWEKVEAVDEWSERIEAMIDSLHKRLPAYGIIELSYVSDDPADLVFGSGQKEAAWTIEFEARYVVDSVAA